MPNEYYVDDNCGWGPVTVREVEVEVSEDEEGRLAKQAEAEQFGERYNAARLEGDHYYALWFAGLPR
jgi:hypothetical protein